jgi:acetyl esterase/lipase
VEYRRPDRHGWDATTHDVEAAIRHLARLDVPGLDLARVALVGHSAGGQLAVRAAADLARGHDDVTPAQVVSLAGVLDLHETYGRDLGDGAARTALGAGPDVDPDAYARSSPLALLPVGVPTLVMTASGDSPDLNEMGSRYAAAARAVGDPVTELTGAGDHFTLIDPSSQVWADVRSYLRTLQTDTASD